jgi:hypothetical protein
MDAGAGLKEEVTDMGSRAFRAISVEGLEDRLLLSASPLPVSPPEPESPLNNAYYYQPMPDAVSIRTLPSAGTAPSRQGQQPTAATDGEIAHQARLEHESVIDEYFERHWAEVRAELLLVATANLGHAGTVSLPGTPQPKPEVQFLGRPSDVPLLRAETPTSFAGPPRLHSALTEVGATSPPLFATPSDDLPDPPPQTAEGVPQPYRPPPADVESAWRVGADSIPLVAGLVRVDLRSLGEGVDVFFAQLESLPGAGETRSTLLTLAVWVVVAGAVGYEVARRPRRWLAAPEPFSFPKSRGDA